MNPTKPICNLLLALAAAVTAAPAYAQISFNMSIAPPAPQYEVVPVVAPGYVWAPGYWGWAGARHVWVRGRTIVQREGYRWAPDRWDQRNGGYYRTEGHWEHDGGYKPIKLKKKRRDNDNRGNGNNTNRGRGNNGKHGS